MSTIEEITAYAGTLEMETATWDTDWGMYVRFLIPQQPEDIGRSNPFKKYTKARKDRVGSRFHAVFEHDDEIAYDDEIMLKGWGDGINGWKVTLWISSYAEHPFLKFNKGDTFHVALVELQDDNTPVNQVKKERLTVAEARKRFPLAMLAAQLCKRDDFKIFLMRSYGLKNMMGGMVTETQAADYIKTCCHIESRRQLDTDDRAADIFHNSFRKPYVHSIDKG